MLLTGGQRFWSVEALVGRRLHLDEEIVDKLVGGDVDIVLGGVDVFLGREDMFVGWA